MNEAEYKAWLLRKRGAKKACVALGHRMGNFVGRMCQCNACGINVILPEGRQAFGNALVKRCQNV